MIVHFLLIIKPIALFPLAWVGGQTIVDFLSAGGVVMVPLILFSILAIALIIERSRFWWQVNQRHSPFANAVMELYQNQPDLVMEKVKRNLDLPLARILMAALELDHPTPDQFKLALESETQAELPGLRRFSNVFDTIAGMAPLLGLLGTVLGLITSFGSLNIGDIGGTKTVGVSAGISEALISTASGLVVALFTLMFANIFRACYQRQLFLIEEYGSQLELFYRRRYEQTVKTSPVIEQLSAAIRQLVLNHQRSDNYES
jgi:biopolymer transport protein ExbB